MSNVERSGVRAGRPVNAYSRWHRTLTPTGTPELGFLDIDWVEFCSYRGCKRRLAIFELAFEVDDGAQDDKNAWQTQMLARDSHTPAFVVLYHTREARDPGTVSYLRVRQLWPDEETAYTRFAPDKWSERLFALRKCHPLRRLAIVPKQINHTHGYQAADDGTFRCVQDYYAVGTAPETGCGQTWETLVPQATPAELDWLA